MAVRTCTVPDLSGRRSFRTGNRRGRAVQGSAHILGNPDSSTFRASKDCGSASDVESHPRNRPKRRSRNFDSGSIAGNCSAAAASAGGGAGIRWVPGDRRRQGRASLRNRIRTFRAGICTPHRRTSRPNMPSSQSIRSQRRWPGTNRV